MKSAQKTMKTSKLSLLAGAAALAALAGPLAVGACDSSSGVHETVTDAAATDGYVAPPGDAGGGDGGGDGSAADCVVNPKTHVEIINACTDASKFDKTPSLPLLLADGGLPPLR